MNIPSKALALVLIGMLSAVLLSQVAGKKTKPFYLDILPISPWPIEATIDDRTYAGMSLKHGENEHLAPFIFWEGKLDGPHYFSPILDNQNERYIFRKGEAEEILERYSIYYDDLKSKELVLMKGKIDPEIYHSPEDLKKLAVDLLSVRLFQNNLQSPIQH